MLRQQYSLIIYNQDGYVDALLSMGVRVVGLKTAINLELKVQIIVDANTIRSKENLKLSLKC